MSFEAEDSTQIEIIGATANNLRQVDIRFPLRAATLVTGVSGSGKSSLLEDTLATEANNRMQRFLQVRQDHLQEAETQAFVGPLPACLHFSQGAFRASSRTTVATCSGLLRTLRRLFLRHGHPWVDELDEPVPVPSADSYADWLRVHYRGALTIWALPLRNKASDGRSCVEHLRQLGVDAFVLRSETDNPKQFERGRRSSTEDFRPLSARHRHFIEVEVARLQLPRDGKAKLHQLVQRAFEVGNGTVLVELPDAPPELAANLQGPGGTALDSDLHLVHPASALPFQQVSEALLSFNMPGNPRSGACPHCQGLGRASTVAESLLVGHPERSMHKGALALWTRKNYRYVNIQHETIEGLRGLRDFDPDAPWSHLPEDARQLVLQGSGDQEVCDRERGSGRKLSTPRCFEGFIPAILSRHARGTRTSERLAEFVREGDCPACGGSRWSASARALRLGPPESQLHRLLSLSFDDLAAASAETAPLPTALPQAAAWWRELHHHSRAFSWVGLGHLSGDRGMLTVSEGESRRVRLAGLLQLGGRDLGLLLDEPARGLHEADIARLAEAISELKQHHTVILNDHRFSLGKVVDHVVQLGPGAGSKGGRVQQEGPPEQVLQAQSPPQRSRLAPPESPDAWIDIRDAHLHTLRGVDVRLPLGRLTAITGVSGSGKSNFVRGILVPALATELGLTVDDFETRPGVWREIRGARQVRDLLALDQKRPGSQRRSLVFTALGLSDSLRRAFAATAAARDLGLEASDFSLNTGRGRCPTCLGLGELEEHHEWRPCPTCGGRRFRDEVFSVRLHGLHIGQVLDSSLTELLLEHAWQGLPELESVGRLLLDLDLGYLSLGRRMDRLSGGETQRLRIALRLDQASEGGLLLVLDEPSAGLHPEDVRRLLTVLDRIVGEGENTVVLVEHNLDLIRASDWLLDFGPGGGPRGGQLIAAGPPKKVRHENSATGHALRGSFEGPDSASPTGLQRSLPSTSDTSISGPAAIDPETAAQARSWLRLLLGHETTLPADSERDSLAQLAVVAGGETWRGRRPHEVGDLDLEWARYVLLQTAPPSRDQQLARLVAAWAEHPPARVWIHPFLSELQVWGPRLPRTVHDSRRAYFENLGLQQQYQVPQEDTRPSAAVQHTGVQKALNLRISGERFHNPNIEPTDRLEDAWLLGGGYVELRAPDGRLLDNAGDRYLDLERGLVAPLRLTAPSLSRWHPAGRCPACQGRGQRSEPPVQLVLNESSEATVEDEVFLRPQALAVLRGVRRSHLLPFLRRLGDEQLWPKRASWRTLDDDQRGWLLHGYWHRPGTGSFLKRPDADPGEARSWLRWDGLHAHLLEQVERSKDQKWQREVKAGLRSTTCPHCLGSGLAQHASALRWQGHDLCAWLLAGRTVSDLVEALRRDSPVQPRAKAHRQRLLACLQPLTGANAPELGHVLDDDTLARRVYERVVQTFSRLPLLPAP